jgi:hypothetical protein
LNRFVDFGGIYKVGCPELPGPCFFTIVGIDSNNLSCSIGNTSLNYAETNASSTEDSDVRAFLNFGGLGSGSITSRDTTTQKTSLIKRGLWVYSNNGDVGNNYLLDLTLLLQTCVLRES